jgi:hypothetical protein
VKGSGRGLITTIAAFVSRDVGNIFPVLKHHTMKTNAGMEVEPHGFLTWSLYGSK